MLVPAMAFAWCVISAQTGAAEPQSALRVEPAHAETSTASGRPRAAFEGPRSPAPTRSRNGERIPIRTAIPAEVIAYAKTLVNLPMGAEQVATIGGTRYVFVLERHYHPPGFVGAPSGWHKGVTAYLLRPTPSEDGF
jgi:hypothetical protein